MITREAALELLKTYNKEPFHIQHALTVEGVMRWYARELGYGNEEEYWGLTGLLHDIDFELYPEEHCKKAPELLSAGGVEEDMIGSICSHGYGICCDVEPKHEMEKVLFAADELTGLIWSAALMRPSKSVMDMEVKSLKKKFKDKRFAAGCSREIIAEGAKRLGWELDQLFEKTILAMRSCEESVAAELESCQHSHGKSKVYYTDFRCKMNEGLPTKLTRLLKEAGLDQIDMDGKIVAIKMHFGELGNLSFLRPNYARTVADFVKAQGGKPFLTDCNTLYPGSRKNAIEHLYCAWENGFTPMTVGCPVIIGDGLKGTDDVTVPVVDGEYVKEAKIGHAIMDADVFISLTHFKGHEMTGFGGTIKNIGMGCGSRAGKKDQHCNGKPLIRRNKCKGCRRCEKECANGGLVFDEEDKKMTLDLDRCVGCGRCIGSCNFDAIRFVEDAAVKELNCRMAEYAKAVVYGRPNFHISLVCDISPNCDCHAENDAPILPDVGMFASFDPLALDQACADACLKQTPLPNSQLAEQMASEDFCDHHDHFENTTPNTEYKTCLAHGEKIGLGSREYELIFMK